MSQAGCGLGMRDSRTGMASHIWRIYDACDPEPLLDLLYLALMVFESMAIAC